MSIESIVKVAESQTETKPVNQIMEKQESGGELSLLTALADVDVWNRLVKLAEVYSKSTLMPDHFRGSQGNCIIMLQLAIRMEVDPFMLAQNMYIVHGKPGLEAKFAIAMCNSKKVFRGPIRYDLSGKGKTRACMAYAYDRETGERVEETVTMEMADKEGWTTKKGSKWLTIPDLMLKYRSALWLIRTTCPEVLMGMQSSQEIEDIAPEIIDVDHHVGSTDTRPKSEQLAEQLGERLSENQIEKKSENGEPERESTALQLFRADMHAARDLDSLTEIKKSALAESQQGNLTMSEWQDLKKLAEKLAESF